MPGLVDLLAATALAAVVGWGWTLVLLRRARADSRTAAEPEKLLEDLADQAAQLTLAEDAAGLGIWQLDAVASTLTFSPGAAVLLGLPRQSVTLTSGEAMSRVHPDDRAAFNAARLRSHAGQLFQCEHRIVWPDGSEHWLRVHGRPVMISGQHVRTTGSVIDIDRERRMLDELRVNAARMRLAEQAAGFGVTDLDLANGRVMFSAGWAALYGVDPALGSLTSAEIDPMIHPDDLPRVHAECRGALISGRSELEFRVIRADGCLRWHRAIAVPPPATGSLDGGESPDPKGRLLCAILDITREREMLDRLRHSVAHMRVAEEIGAFGLWEVNVRDREVRMSEGMRRLAGMPADTPLSIPLDEFYGLLDADDRMEMQASHQRAFREGTPVSYERQWILQDGSARWHRSYGQSQLADGQPWRILGASMDVTAHKELQISLEAARVKAEAATVAKSEFLANMSHEIRTPLNGVLGMTSLLLETSLSDEQREYAETLKGSGESLLTLIDDLLDFSKIEAGRVSMESAEFDLCRTLENVAEMVSPRAQQSGIELLVRYPAGAPRRFVGDQARVKQVVANLASNAVKFTRRGHVLLSVECTVRSVSIADLTVTVFDTGIGVPQAKLEHLFQKFTQADASTTHEYGGTGLGLAISKSLIELMGGHIGVDSNEGRGSAFWFSLPMPLGDCSELPAPAVVPPGRRVLVFGGSDVSRTVICEQLAASGSRPDAFVAPDEAADAVSAADASGDPFEILIAGLDAVDRKGRPIAAALLARSKRAPLAYIAVSPLRHAKIEPPAGVVVAAYLTAPLSPTRLLNALGSAWANRSEALSQRAAAASAPAAALAGPPASSTAAAAAPDGPHVLIVEDNFPNQKVLVLLLKKLGVRMDVAENGVLALERLMAGPYDLVLMDCHMPELNGYEAAAEVRRREGPNRDVPIVAVTADVASGSRERALESGMNDFIGKPIHVSELERVLLTWIRPERRSAALVDAG